mmetsp:Transcript_49842/g.162918  ORF Transcript_49842/g.162918 Transcript_49842/m.162918 type:complete len:268 (+) Transcript_49842:126-929(+)
MRVETQIVVVVCTCPPPRRHTRGKLVCTRTHDAPRRLTLRGSSSPPRAGAAGRATGPSGTRQPAAAAARGRAGAAPHRRGGRALRGRGSATPARLRARARRWGGAGRDSTPTSAPTGRCRAGGGAGRRGSWSRGVAPRGSPARTSRPRAPSRAPWHPGAAARATRVAMWTTSGASRLLRSSPGPRLAGCGLGCGGPLDPAVALRRAPPRRRGAAARAGRSTSRTRRWLARRAARRPCGRRCPRVPALRKSRCRRGWPGGCALRASPT